MPDVLWCRTWAQNLDGGTVVCGPVYISLPHQESELFTEFHRELVITRYGPNAAPGPTFAISKIHRSGKVISAEFSFFFRRCRFEMCAGPLAENSWAKCVNTFSEWSVKHGDVCSVLPKVHNFAVN